MPAWHLWLLAIPITVAAALSPQRLETVLAPAPQGVWVAWCDRIGEGPVRLRLGRLPAAEATRPPRPGEGVLVAEGAEPPSGLVLVHDEAGGAWIAWCDRRQGPRRVHAARVDAEGRVASRGGPVGHSGREDFRPALLAAGDGGAYLAWQSWNGRDSDIRVQRLDARGEPAPGWPLAGLALADSPFDECQPEWTVETSGPRLGWTAYDGPDPARGVRRDADVTAFEPRGTVPGRARAPTPRR